MLGAPRQALVTRILLPTAGQRFVRVPIELLEANLPAACERLWIRLASLNRGPYSLDYKTYEEVACAVGTTKSSMYANLKILHEAGWVNRKGPDLILEIPHVVEEENEGFAEQVAAQPKRKPSGVTQPNSMKEIAAAWNKYKPAKWTTISPKMNPGTFIAIETQAKKLGIARPDYPEMIKRICLAASVDEWWKEKTLKPSNVFGFGANLEDRKFETVEKLYKEGSSEKAEAAAFDSSPDGMLEWYRKHKAPFTSIFATDVPEDLEDTSPKDWAFDHWDSTEVDEDVARVYYYKGKPIAWSNMSRRPFLYLPNS